VCRRRPRPAGVLDLRPALEAVQAGACLNAKQLEGVAASLEGAFALREQATAPADATSSGSSVGSSTGSSAAAASASVAGTSGHGAGASAAGSSGPGAQQQGCKAPTLAKLAQGICEEERDLLAALRRAVR